MALAGNRLFIAGTFTTVKSLAHRRAGVGQRQHWRHRPVSDDQPDRPPQLRPGRRRAPATRRRHRDRGLAGRHAHDRRRQLHHAADDGRARTPATRSRASSSARPATVDPNWNTNAYTHPCYSWAYDSYVRDIGWSPDGSYFAVAATGGYNDGSFQDCDSASRFNASSTRPDRPARLGRLHRYRLALLGRRHVRRRLRRRSPPLAEQPLRPGQPQDRVPFRGRALQRSTPPTAFRFRGTRAVTRAGTALRSSTPPRPASGSAATPTTSATTSTSARSWSSSPSPAARPRPATTPATRTACSSPARTGTLTANSFDPTTGAGSVATTQPEQAGGSHWSTLTGAFVLNGRIWYASGGKFYYRTWDGANDFGAAQLVDPYDDPYWDNVQPARAADLPGATGRASTPSCPR